MKFSFPSSHNRSAAAWTRDDLRRLRELAAAGASVQLIAAKLNRTPKAIRTRATLQGVSLRSAAAPATPAQKAETDALP